MSGIYGFTYRAATDMEFDDALDAMVYWNRSYGSDASAYVRCHDSALGSHVEHFSDKFPCSEPVQTFRDGYAVVDALLYNRDELFERINNYIESKICEPLTVAEICQQFSISRSTLQLLFKNAVNQSPKKYISDMKLEKSCQMLRENKYTISEISLKLGYSSIHYFSNAFNQKYHISPSEYAKRIY